MTERSLDEAAAAQEALRGEEEALRTLALCESIDDLLARLVGLQERRVVLEGQADPGLANIIRTIQRQTDIERAMHMVRAWFHSFHADRSAEIDHLLRR